MWVEFCVVSFWLKDMVIVIICLQSQSLLSLVFLLHSMIGLRLPPSCLMVSIDGIYDEVRLPKRNRLRWFQSIIQRKVMILEIRFAIYEIKRTCVTFNS